MDSKRINHLLITLLFLIGVNSIIVAQEKNTILENWEEINIPNNEVFFHKMAGIDNQLWAVDYGNGFVYQSMDNGEQWTRNAELGSEYFEAIQFVDSQLGFICGDYGFVYKTIDEGKSWQEISPPINQRITEKYRNDSTKNQNPDGLFVVYYSMYFANQNEGFVAGYQFNPSKGQESFKRLFFKTADGGMSWKNEEDQANYLNSIEDKTTIHNITIHGKYFWNNEISWKNTTNEVRKPILIREELSSSQRDTMLLPDPPFERKMLRSTVFLNANTGYIFGGSLDENNQQAIILQTDDSGKSWKYLPTEWPHIHFAFVHKNYLWISGKNGMLKRKYLL